MANPLGLTQTHTYVIMEVSPNVYDEIEKNFREAGYDHVFHVDGDGHDIMDMQGVAIKRKED